MKDRFYYKTKGKTYGPVPFVKLVDALRRGKFSVDDQVRMQGSNNWLVAGSVMKSLMERFPEIANISGMQKYSNIEAAPLKTKSSTPSASVGISILSWLYAVIDFFKACVGATLGAGSNVGERVSDILSTLFAKLFSKQGFFVLAIAVWVSLSGYMFVWMNRPYKDGVSVYNQLVSTWSNLKQLRENKATEEEWDQFLATAKPEIEKVVLELERSATPDDEVRMQLLWASRDFLTKMLHDSRESPSHNETIFGEHMEYVARSLNRSGIQVQQL